jgi:hypothetical protein
MMSSRKAEALDHRQLVAPLIFMDVPAHLKCPSCFAEFASELVTSLDSVVECVVCGARFEFRQLHEAWCRARRLILGRAFPELDFTENVVSMGREGLTA